MQYTISGQGQPIVLIHGFGEDSRIWESQVVALSLWGKVILPDLPGTGKSPQESALSIPSMADGIAAILQREGIEKAWIIGHSMGGYISLAFAEKYPEKLLGLGLVHSTAFADTEQKKAMRLKSMEFIRQHGTAAYLNSSTPNLFAPGNRVVMATIVQHVANTNSYILPGALISFLDAMRNRKDTTEVLRNISVPVLFIVGKADQAVPFTDTMQQVHLPDLSYIHILQQSGHMGMLEETEKCTDAILQFVAGTSRL